MDDQRSSGFVMVKWSLFIFTLINLIASIATVIVSVNNLDASTRGYSSDQIQKVQENQVIISKDLKK